MKKHILAMLTFLVLIIANEAWNYVLKDNKILFIEWHNTPLALTAWIFIANKFKL